jgi:hypothetical protein
VNAVTLVSDKQPSADDVAAVFDDGAHRYALRSDAVRAVPWGAALNTHFWWGPAAARPAEVVAEDLRARILALYDKHLSADGRAVSYAALKQDPEFWDYVDATAELQRVSVGSGKNAGHCKQLHLIQQTICLKLTVHCMSESRGGMRSNYMTPAWTHTLYFRYGSRILLA